MLLQCFYSGCEVNIFETFSFLISIGQRFLFLQKQKPIFPVYSTETFSWICFIRSGGYTLTFFLKIVRAIGKTIRIRRWRKLFCYITNIDRISCQNDVTESMSFLTYPNHTYCRTFVYGLVFIHRWER